MATDSFIQSAARSAASTYLLDFDKFWGLISDKSKNAKINLDIGKDTSNSDVIELMNYIAVEARTTINKNNDWYGIKAGELEAKRDIANNNPYGDYVGAILKGDFSKVGVLDESPPPTPSVNYDNVILQFKNRPILIPMYLLSTLLTFFAFKKIVMSKGGLSTKIVADSLKDVKKLTQVIK